VTVTGGLPTGASSPALKATHTMNSAQQSRSLTINAENECRVAK
jgi:hypothetical protein